VVLADRFGPPSRELAGEEGVAMLRRLQPLLGTAALVAAGEGQAGLVLDAVRDLRLERDRVVGSAPEAFAAAVAAIVALEAQASPREVSVSVVGSPGHLAAPLNETAVGGYALDRVVTPAQFARIEARAARLWPPGPYALGAAAARMAEALVTGSRRSFSAYTVLDGELGVRNRVGALPVALGVGRVRQRRIPALTTRERVRLETALGAP
jgi:malate/lactate dehydrogenase